LDRAVFNRAISDSAPAGGRANWKVGVFYNHGMTLMGTPSDRHSMPIGIPLEIKVEPRGLLTVTRYSRSTLADEILDNIREGSISGYSFSGAFRRSTPAKPRGGWRPDNAGGLTTVRRLESTLREYGPTPFPAYATASVVGMRAAELLQYGYTPQQVQDIVESSYGAPSADSPDPDAPKREDYAGLVTEDSLPERSGRSVKGQMRANRSAFLQRHGWKPHDHQI
jgi:phage head maturation protease